MTGKIFEAIRIIAIFLAAGMSLSAHAGLFGFGGDSWKEEALQPDGSTIIVELTVEHGGRHEIGQEPPYKWQRLRFTIPATGEVVTWEDNYSDDVGSANFLPMLLDIEQGAVYLVADTMGCLAYNKWGRPNPPYVVFKYMNKEWKRIPLKELPADIKTPNLIFSSPDFEVKKIGKSLIPAETISQIISRYPQPQYRSILREPIQNPGGRCPDFSSPQMMSPKAPLPVQVH